MLTQMVGFVQTAVPERARAFYGDTLGFRFLEDDGFALSFDANGTRLRVAKARAFTPSPATVLGWEVPDLATEVRAQAQSLDHGVGPAVGGQVVKQGGRRVRGL